MSVRVDVWAWMKTFLRYYSSVSRRLNSAMIARKSFQEHAGRRGTPKFPAFVVPIYSFRSLFLFWKSAVLSPRPSLLPNENPTQAYIRPSLFGRLKTILFGQYVYVARRYSLLRYQLRYCRFLRFFWLNRTKNFKTFVVEVLLIQLFSTQNFPKKKHQSINDKSIFTKIIDNR